MIHAEAALGTLPAGDPQPADLALRARVHASAGRWATALSTVSLAMAAEADPMRQLGLSEQRVHFARELGDPGALHSALLDLVARQPTPDAALVREFIALALAQGRLGDALTLRARQVDIADREQTQDDPTWWPQLLMRHQHFALAERAYLDALRRDPPDVHRQPLWLGLGYAAEKVLHFRTAWRAFRHAADLQPTPQALAAVHIAERRVLTARAQARAVAAGAQQ